MNKTFAVAALALAGMLAGCAGDSCSSCCAADDAGFVQLFNGKDLAGWTGGVDGYEVADGVLNSKKGGKGNLLTEKVYKDFDLRLEFKLTEAANNGIGVRMPLVSKAGSYEGMEVQLLDDSGYSRIAKKPLEVWQYCGSLYGISPAKQRHVKPPGQWNEMRIVAQGRKVQVYLNDTLVTDADLTGKPIDGKEHPGMSNTDGRVGFLGHNDVVYFRNIRIKEL